MLDVTKWQKFYNNQPQSIKVWLDSQSVWSDKDMFVAAAIGVVIGLILGLIL